MSQVVFSSEKLREYYVPRSAPFGLLGTGEGNIAGNVAFAIIVWQITRIIRG